MLRLLCLCEHGGPGPVGFRREDLGFRGDFGLSRGKIRAFLGKIRFSWGRIRILGKDSGFREEDVRLSGFRAKGCCGKDFGLFVRRISACVGI